MRHIQDLQKYSVYDVTVNRTSQDNGTAYIGKPGVLQEIVYTPPQQKQHQTYYIYGKNQIDLNYDGTSIWRKAFDQPDGEDAQTIIFNVTTNNKKSQHTVFSYTGIIELTLCSQRILIGRQESSWYTWNSDMSKCLITHNLDGYVDFITRYQGKEQIYVPNIVKNPNSIELDFSDFFNKDLVQLLKYFKLSQTSNIKLSNLVDFSLYNLPPETIIGIFKDTDTDQPSNIEGVENGSHLEVSGRYNDMYNRVYTFSDTTYYKIYAIVPKEKRTDYVQMVVWKLDQIADPLKQNVFSYQKYASTQCVWQRFDNDQGYDLQIPYRFTFLGYTRNHKLPLTVTDPTGQIFLQKAQSWADTKTMTTDLCITKQFTYGLQNKKMKVLTPNLETKDQCDFILIYSSCWAQSYFCNLTDPRVGQGTWSTKKNMYNQQVQVLTLRHNLNGIVKVHIRDIREDLYDTYILNNNTIQIVFMKHYKYNKYEFYVDLYTIWKNDN